MNFLLTPMERAIEKTSIQLSPLLHENHSSLSQPLLNKQIGATRHLHRHSTKTKLKPNVQDPFWATRLWQHLVQHVKVSVKIGKHRHLFKYYDDVFSGTNVVDVVFHCLSTCVSEVVTQDITRSHASKVCQVLMESGLFECVMQKGCSRFEDNASRFYRFSNEESQETVTHNRFLDFDKENARSTNPVDSLTNSIPGISEMCHQENVKDESDTKSSCSRNDSFSLAMSSTPITLSNIKSRRSTLTPTLNNVASSKENEVHFVRKAARSSLLKIKRLEIRDQVQLTSTSKTPSDGITEDIHLVMKEQALVHLLTLVDVPILETILSIPSSLPRLVPTVEQLTIQNNGDKLTNIDLSSKYGNIHNIPWVSAAENCLGKVPDGVGHLWSLQACKILCYQTVVEYCSSMTGTIVPAPFVCICTGIIDMLKKEARTKALLATQLLMVVLPWQRSKQLFILLKFLHLVVSDIFVSVDKKVTNYEAVSRDFLNIVLQHPCLSKENCQILFDFLVFKVDHIFQIIPCLDHLRKRGIAFCEQVKPNQFSRETIIATEESLRHLAFNIMDSTTLKLNEKRHWMKKFKKTHPQIYRACVME